MQLIQESIYETVLNQLTGVYKQVKIGDPLEKGTLVGPLHTRASKENFEKGIEIIKSQACILSLVEKSSFYTSIQTHILGHMCLLLFIYVLLLAFNTLLSLCTLQFFSETISKYLP